MRTAAGLVVRGNFSLPTPPLEIADEVELYARQSGRHATLHFVPVTSRVGCWVVRMTLRPDDKRRRLWQEQKVGTEPTEDIWLHVPLREGERKLGPTYDYRPLNLVDLGTSGVRQFLERGNLWSGRGEYQTLEEQVTKLREADANATAKFRADVKEEAMDEMHQKRRTRLKIPFLPVSLPWRSRQRKEQG